MGGETPGCLMISVCPQSNFPAVLHGNLTLAAGNWGLTSGSCPGR